MGRRRFHEIVGERRGLRKDVSETSSEPEWGELEALHLPDPSPPHVGRPVFLGIQLCQGKRRPRLPIRRRTSKTRLAKSPQGSPNRPRGPHPLAHTDERTSCRYGVSGLPHRIFLNQIRRDRSSPRDLQGRSKRQFPSRLVACERTISRREYVSSPSDPSWLPCRSCVFYHLLAFRSPEADSQVSIFTRPTDEFHFTGD